MFRFLFRILLLAGLVWASFVLEYQGRPLRHWVQDWAATAWDRAWPLAKEMARRQWEEAPRALFDGPAAEGAPEARAPDAAQPRGASRRRVEALAEARERVAPRSHGENPDYDRPQSPEEQRQLDERLRRGLR
jgi:hypothetical protein